MAGEAWGASDDGPELVAAGRLLARAGMRIALVQGDLLGARSADSREVVIGCLASARRRLALMQAEVDAVLVLLGGEQVAAMVARR